MTDLSSPTPADMPPVPDVKPGPLFYVVALRKFAILFVATFGVYQVYWFYKNWSNFKNRMPSGSDAGTAIWLVPRAVFSVFFVHALFKAVKHHAPGKPAVAAWGQSAHATLVVVLILLSNVLSRMSEKIDGNFWLNMAALLIVFPLMVAIRNAQAMINIACDDPQGRTNATLTWANTTWIAIGALCWVLVLIGTFAMGPDAVGGAGFHSGGDGGF